LTCPADIVAECTSPSGAVVTYTASATDVCDPSPTVTCSPASGSTFAIGTTTVNCTATDDSGNTSTCSFQVTVRDTTPPVLTCPADIVTECTSASGAAVTYTAGAKDACDPNPTVACSPASGSTFPIGTTTVTCTATDDAGNTTSCTFQVTVEDKTAPTLGAITATQGATDVKDCANPTHTGQVEISVEASDQCGLAGPPTVVLVNGANMESATFVSESPPGVFNYTWDVLATTAEGTWTATVTATDAAGNTAMTSFTLCVERFEVTGEVQSQGFVGGMRNVVFVATDAANNVLATRTLTLTFTGDTAPYTLSGVPANTAHLSVKTAWTLRVRQDVTFVSGQAVNNFVGADQMRGGDIAPQPMGDNQVNFPDYAQLADDYFTTNPRSDINGDGVVNVIDYSIMADNWFTTGDPE
jgi:hypothetical protein